MKKKNAIIVVDLQNDFCPGGALAVNEGDRIVPIINKLVPKFDLSIATQDWHPASQISFASNHENKQPFDTISINGVDQILWPDHCVQGTKGADFHPDLDTDPFNLILRKGTSTSVDSYSAFMENDKKTKTGLEGYLSSLYITELFLCGLATDFCVFFSAMDAARVGFNVTLIIDACRGIDQPEHNIENAIKTMRNAEIRIIESGKL